MTLSSAATSVLFYDAASPNATAIPPEQKRKAVPNDDSAASGAKRSCIWVARAGGTETRHSGQTLDHASREWLPSEKQRSVGRRNIPNMKPILWTKEFIEGFGITFVESGREREGDEQMLQSTNEVGRRRHSLLGRVAGPD